MLSKQDISVLEALSVRGSVGEPWFYPFKSIAEITRLDIQEVRRRVRRLARKGYAEFSKGLWTEDGEPAGSGYAITPAGRQALAAPSPEPKIMDGAAHAFGPPPTTSEAELEARWREALEHSEELPPLPFPKRRVCVQGPLGLICVGGTITAYKQETEHEG